MVKSYHKRMGTLIDLNEQHNRPVDISRKTEYLQFYINKQALASLVTLSMTCKNFDSLGVFFGVDKNKGNKTTACFLALDTKGQVCAEHWEYKRAGRTRSEGLPGEENWPPPPESGTKLTYLKALTLEAKEQDIDDFFTTKGS